MQRHSGPSATRTIHPISSLTVAVAVLSALSGAVGSLLLQHYLQKKKESMPDDRHHELVEAQNRRRRLPALIIFVRHGESEGNADHTLWRTMPDNLVELTETGLAQADEAGKRIENIFKTYDDAGGKQTIRRVHLLVSPFERTIQTAITMRRWFDHRIVRTEVESRIREQEFGNLQGEQFESFRKEQKMVGRFWYRFPTGESGSDVYDRVKSWWFESVLCVNERVGYDHVDALVVVTHGLTMRFALMQLYSWSPTTFHSVWNAENCDAYVLRKDMKKPGLSPYVLDDQLGDSPRSTIDLIVDFKNGTRGVFKLEDYLSIPPPRTTKLNLVKEKLAKQFPDKIDIDHIASVCFLPFHQYINDDTNPNGASREGVKEISPFARISPKAKFTNMHQTRCGESSCRFPNVATAVALDQDPKELSIDSGGTIAAHLVTKVASLTSLLGRVEERRSSSHLGEDEEHVA